MEAKTDRAGKRTDRHSANDKRACSDDSTDDDVPVSAPAMGGNEGVSDGPAHLADGLWFLTTRPLAGS